MATDHTTHRTDDDRHDDADENRDPITGAKGAHPIGSGLGAAAGGAAAGAAVGSVAGPIGTAAGVIVGGLIGGYAGKGVAEMVDPTEEHEYWRNEHRNRDYAKRDDRNYDEHYGPAYQYGWESYGKEHDRSSGKARSFDEVEGDLGNDWNKHRSDSDLSWDEAKPATRDAYNRSQTIVVDKNK